MNKLTKKEYKDLLKDLKSFPHESWEFSDALDINWNHNNYELESTAKYPEWQEDKKIMNAWKQGWKNHFKKSTGYLKKYGKHSYAQRLRGFPKEIQSDIKMKKLYIKELIKYFDSKIYLYDRYFVVNNFSDIRLLDEFANDIPKINTYKKEILNIITVLEILFL